MPETTIDDLLRSYSPQVRDLALRTCALIRGVLPDATEQVHPGWKVIVFGTGEGMRDRVFAVAPHRERVNLQLSGADLPDPTGLLGGTGKAMRHVKVTRPEVLEDPALHALLRAAVEAHRTPKAERAAKAGPPVEGYRAYASRTVNVPVERLFAAWVDEDLRRRWLDARIELRGATQDRSLRARWPDGTPFEARFEMKGEAKSQVSVDHQRIATEDSAAETKAAWRDRLGRLKSILEETG